MKARAASSTHSTRGMGGGVHLREVGRDQGGRVVGGRDAMVGARCAPRSPPRVRACPCHRESAREQ
eukprot:306560-Rhodomonas_salina.1